MNRKRGERAQNIDQAISHFRHALQVYTLQAFPVNWAATQVYLGSAYQDRIRGERAENIDRVIGHFQQALEVFTHDDYTEQWTKIQEGLATVDRERNRRAKDPQASPMDSSPILTYRQFYSEESQLVGICLMVVGTPPVNQRL